MSSSNDPWRRNVHQALRDTGRAYFAVFVDTQSHGVVTMATIDVKNLPAVLRGIADDVENGRVKLNHAEPEAAKA